MESEIHWRYINPVGLSKAGLIRQFLIFCGLRDIFKAYGFENVWLKGADYFPLPSLLGSIDVRHAHFLSLKAKKPR